jgi:shikimate dehydrogenase
VTSDTSYAEVIGDPVAHSKSPMIHLFWLDRLGVGTDYRKTKVEAAGLEDFLARRRADPDWLGCNVTIPHKQAVGAHLDRLDPAAEKIGAVNMIVREGGELVGYNSDAAGFLEPLRPLLSQRHLFRMARIIGAGGAARAVAHALWRHGFTIVIIARDPAKAEALRSQFDPAHSYVGALADFAVPTDFAFDSREGILDLVVNTTSLGMEGQPPLQLDFSHVPPGAIIYDVVYAPLETPLLAEARSRGLRTVDGLEMLVGQAAIAFEKFFGHPAPRQHDAELRAIFTL